MGLDSSHVRWLGSIHVDMVMECELMSDVDEMENNDMKLSEILEMAIDKEMTGLEMLNVLKRTTRGDANTVKHYWLLMLNGGVVRSRCLNCTKIIPDKRGKRGRKRHFCNLSCTNKFWYDSRKEKKFKERAKKIREEIGRLKMEME